MKSFSLTLLIFIFSTALSFSQNLTQTVRGTVIDADSKLPLIGAAVIIPGSRPLIGTATDVNGEFKLENVPVGRTSLKISYMGYEAKIIPNIVVNSGKEVVLHLSMQESVITMDEVVVKPDRKKGVAINNMAVVSARSISPEETKRYAGGFNDPSRILLNFAGVTSTQSGRNDIIIRGNSPKYIQWHLEGIPITNPNHFADQNAMGGGAVSALNNKLLATSDFYTGAFPPGYGNALSGVYNVKIRSGNNETFESAFGFGLLGTDIMLEGPFKKGYDGSYLVNYRYSTISIIDNLGIVDIGGAPKFQDAAFKVVLPTKNIGKISLFGLGGYSSFLFEDVTPVVYNTPGNRGMRADIKEDFSKESYFLNTGLNHTLFINNHSYLKTSLSFSGRGINDDIFETHISDGYKVLNFKSRLMKSTYRGAITYNNKLNAKNNIQIGTKYAIHAYDYNQSMLKDDGAARFTAINFDEYVGTLNNFISWKYRLNEEITIVAGLHNMNVLLNNKSTLEPRFALKWELNNTNSIYAGYGSHSTMESIHHYFDKVEQEDGSITELNKDLGLLKAHHYVLGYEKRFTQNLLAKVEVYYQYLYNLPVENSSTSYYATINEGLEYRYVDLVNEGTGENYGVELTIERFFTDSYYFLVNGSLYSSKYTALDGMERNTKYNGNYLVNILFGKEFVNLGRKQNQTLSLNAKVFFGGGQKHIPLLRDEQGNLAVDPENGRYWDYEKAYESSIEDLHMITISASYKWNRPNATHEVFINLDNVTNTKGKISEFYDESEPNSVGYVTQMGFFPNLMYRVYF